MRAAQMAQSFRLARVPVAASRLARLRSLSSSAGPAAADEEQKLGMSTRHPGGVPDFIEMWGPGPFRRTGYALVAASAASFGLAWMHEVGHFLPLLLSGATAGYWTLGLRDLAQRHQALRRNFPVLIHVRYLLESVRPEIQQYLIESDSQAVPFSREADTPHPHSARSTRPDSTCPSSSASVRR